MKAKVVSWMLIVGALTACKTPQKGSEVLDAAGASGECQFWKLDEIKDVSEARRLMEFLLQMASNAEALPLRERAGTLLAWNAEILRLGAANAPKDFASFLQSMNQQGVCGGACALENGEMAPGAEKKIFEKVVLQNVTPIAKAYAQMTVADYNNAQRQGGKATAEEIRTDMVDFLARNLLVSTKEGASPTELAAARQLNLIYAEQVMGGNPEIAQKMRAGFTQYGEGGITVADMIVEALGRNYEAAVEQHWQTRGSVESVEALNRAETLVRGVFGLEGGGSNRVVEELNGERRRVGEQDPEFRKRVEEQMRRQREVLEQHKASSREGRPEGLFEARSLFEGYKIEGREGRIRGREAPEIRTRR